MCDAPPSASNQAATMTKIITKTLPPDIRVARLPTSMHEGNGKAAYIDTEGTFRPERIIPIVEKFGLDPGAVLDNIVCARAFTYEHQYNLLLGLVAKMVEEPFRLLNVDSVIALFRVDFTGRGEVADRQQKLAQMLSRLIKIAEEFNVAVYMTNQGSTLTHIYIK